LFQIGYQFKYLSSYAGNPRTDGSCWYTQNAADLGVSEAFQRKQKQCLSVLRSQLVKGSVETSANLVCHHPVISIGDLTSNLSFAADLDTLSSFGPSETIPDNIDCYAVQPGETVWFGRVVAGADRKRPNENLRSSVAGILDAYTPGNKPEYRRVMPDVDLTELFGVGQRRPNDLSISPGIRGHLVNKPPDATSAQSAWHCLVVRD
jgi:hypothetical protein